MYTKEGIVISTSKRAEFLLTEVTDVLLHSFAEQQNFKS